MNHNYKMDQIIFNEELLKRWFLLSEFVYKICKKRDSSHGHAHMEKVVINSFEILKQLNITDLDVMKDTLTVAWLHDINDRKYDNEGKLSEALKTFLEQNTKNSDYIMNIIDRISFSKEDNIRKKYEKLDWTEVLGVTGCLIRDIVSDADKLEALGIHGLARSIQYVKHKYTEEHNSEIPKELLKKRVLEHAKEKLLRLKAEFIRTEPGRKLAEPLHTEMIQQLEQL